MEEKIYLFTNRLNWFSLNENLKMDFHLHSHYMMDDLDSFVFDDYGFPLLHGQCYLFVNHFDQFDLTLRKPLELDLFYCYLNENIIVNEIIIDDLTEYFPKLEHYRWE